MKHNELQLDNKILKFLTFFKPLLVICKLLDTLKPNKPW